LPPTIESPALDEEMPFIAEVIKGGRLTIPEEIRKLMRINEGNYVLIKLKVVSRKRLGSKKQRRNGNGKNGVSNA
jgi:bifunctional DNA-binding transcriptional regulator/antitoxin component of YhaV-PrlF toxin-antitoxin module